MAAKIELRIDDQTQAGAQSAAANVDKIAGNVDDLRQEFAQATAQADKLADEIDDAADEAKRLASQKGIGKGGLGSQVVELNQGLELLKKGFEVSLRALQTLADNGNPAAQSLLDSFGNLQKQLIAIGDDPTIQNALNGLADIVNNQVAPALGKVPSLIEDVQLGFGYLVSQAGEFTGFFPEGTSEEFVSIRMEIEKTNDAQRELNEEARKTAVVFGRIEEIEKRLTAEAESRNIAAIESEAVLDSLLEDEKEAREELADAGKLEGKALEESDKRIELILRRRMELPKILADRERAAATERIAAEQAVADAAKEALEEADAARAEQTAERIDKKIAEANEAFQRLTDLLAESRGGKPSAIDQARQSLDPRAVRQQLVEQAQARAGFESSMAGGTMAEQRAASRQAGIQAFRQFNAGQTSQADIAAAQNALIQSAAQQAQTRGDLDANTVQALTEAANNQQQIIQTQEQQAQTLQQVVQALQTVGRSANGVRQRAQRGGFGG